MTSEQLKIINTELRRRDHEDNGKIYGFFTSTEGINVRDKIRNLSLGHKDFILDFSEFVNPENLIRTALRRYEQNTGHTIIKNSIRILVPEFHKSIWEGFSDLVCFLDGKLYIDSPEIERAIKESGLEGELRTDLKGRRYFDLSLEISDVGIIEEEILLKRIIEDEA